jgi:uncharacterized protein (TIGR02246 family)
MHRVPHPFAFVVAGLILGACAPAKGPVFDAAAASTALAQRDADWAAASIAGADPDKVASFWSDDATLMLPGQPPVEGKAALRAFVAQAFQTPGFKIHWVSEKPTFSADGTLAYMRAANETTMPGPKGQPATSHLQGYTIWRLDPDGQWRCVVDMATESPAATPPAKS